MHSAPQFLQSRTRREGLVLALALLDIELMNTSVKSFGRSKVVCRMANSMVGRAVTIRVGTGTIRGIVARTVVEAGVPRVVVAGSDYSLGQVLTVAPCDLIPEANC